jgi:hypothetical protein
LAKEFVVPAKRNFSKHKEFIHDLFKLELSSFKKNVNMEVNHNQKPVNPIWVDMPHCHFFHTFDSHGRQMVECVAIAGHKHKMTKISDLEYKAEESVGHTHEVTYIRSEKLSTDPKAKKEQEE